MAIADVLDTVMDRSLVLGYTRIGPRSAQELVAS